MIRQNQQLGQKQLLKLSPQQIQLLNFIQLTTHELEQKINDEVEENPALEPAEQALGDLADPDPSAPNAEEITPVETTSEEYDRFELIDQYHQDDDMPDYKTANDQRGEPEVPFAATLSSVKDFREQIKDQLAIMSLTARELLLAGYLADSLDDDGYLRQDLDDIADTLSFAHGILVETQELEAALEIIQTLEPAGIGARDLRECLQLQLGSLNHHHEGACLAWNIVTNYLHDFANHNYDKLLHSTGATAEELHHAAALIEKLNPKPVGGDSGVLFKNQNIIPEFFVEKMEDGGFRVALANGNTRELRLSPDMTDMLNDMQRNKKSPQDKAAVQYLRSKVDSALWFIEMVRQREQSMLKTMQAIVQLQRDYFISGEVKDLHPMILKDVAAQTGLDISTISRVTSTKYAMTDFGIVHLKELFNQGFAKADGELVTNKEISDIMAAIIQEEDKQNPVTDQEIANLLTEKGYAVARRTVAKYRDAMNIPMAKLRKVMVPLHPQAAPAGS